MTSGNVGCIACYACSCLVDGLWLMLLTNWSYYVARCTVSVLISSFRGFLEPPNTQQPSTSSNPLSPAHQDMSASGRAVAAQKPVWLWTEVVVLGVCLCRAIPVKVRRMLGVLSWFHQSLCM